MNNKNPNKSKNEKRESVPTNLNNPIWQQRSSSNHLTETSPEFQRVTEVKKTPS
jgi:hypothetical protein